MDTVSVRARILGARVLVVAILRFRSEIAEIVRASTRRALTRAQDAVGVDVATERLPHVIASGRIAEVVGTGIAVIAVCSLAALVATGNGRVGADPASLSHHIARVCSAGVVVVAFATDADTLALCAVIGRSAEISVVAVGEIRQRLELACAARLIARINRAGAAVVADWRMPAAHVAIVVGTHIAIIAVRDRRALLDRRIDVNVRRVHPGIHIGTRVHARILPDHVALSIAARDVVAGRARNVVADDIAAACIGCRSDRHRVDAKIAPHRHRGDEQNQTPIHGLHDLPPATVSPYYLDHPGRVFGL